MNAVSKIEAAPVSVYAKIAAVQAELAKIGITKSRKNLTPGQNYNFRGIDEVYNTLSPLMAEKGLCILPRILSRTVSERQTKNGGTLFVAVVEAEFDFVSADDGSIHVVRSYGEAMDSSDKATNKAMSAAYKYMALMTFAIPTEGDNDADATTHEVAPREAAPTVQPITDEQWAKIVSLCQATSIKGAEVKAYVKADNLKVLTPAQFKAAVDYLEGKLAELAKAETNGKVLEDEIPY